MITNIALAGVIMLLAGFVKAWTQINKSSLDQPFAKWLPITAINLMEIGLGTLLTFLFLNFGYFENIWLNIAMISATIVMISSFFYKGSVMQSHTFIATTTRRKRVKSVKGNYLNFFSTTGDVSKWYNKWLDDDSFLGRCVWLGLAVILHLAFLFFN